MNSYHILSFFLTLLKVKYTSVLKKTVGNYLSWILYMGFQVC